MGKQKHVDAEFLQDMLPEQQGGENSATGAKQIQGDGLNSPAAESLQPNADQASVAAPKSRRTDRKRARKVPAGVTTSATAKNKKRVGQPKNQSVAQKRAVQNSATADKTAPTEVKKKRKKRKIKSDAELVKANGPRVRELRLSLGLSQAGLADGICTQATISLVEKQNKMPSMDTMIKVAERLHEQVSDLIMRQDSYAHSRLQFIEDQMHHYKFKQAFNALLTIEESRIESNALVRQYHSMMGALELLTRDNPVEAGGHFARVLATTKQNTNAIANVVAKLGLGLAYADLGKLEKTQVLVKDATKVLGGIDTNNANLADDGVALYWYLTMCYQALSERALAVETSKQAITQALKNGNLYLLDEIYATTAECLESLGGARNRNKAITATQRALSLARIVGNQDLVNKLVAKSDESVIVNCK